MTQPEDKVAMGTRSLVLGFDAGCLKCTELARRIKEQVDGKLEIRSLSDPQVEHWRKSALGDDAPWAPTLIEVEGPKVRAWTGWRLGVNLSRFLGPAATWRVMQALGEVGAAPEAEKSAVAKAAGGLTRGQFLKGVGGAAAAVTMLSGTGKLARPAEAATITDTTEITGSTLVDLARRRARSKDMINVGGQAWSNGMQTGGVTTMVKTIDGQTRKVTIIHHNPSAGSSSRWESDGDLFIDDGDTAIIAGARHELSDGNTLTAVSFLRSNNRLMHSHKYARNSYSTKRKRVVSEAALWKYDATTTKVEVRKFSHNGTLDRSPSSMTRTTAQTQDGGVRTASYHCSYDSCGYCCYYYDYLTHNYAYYGYFYSDNVLTGIDTDCLAYYGPNICGFCAVLSIPGAVACALSLCPLTIIYLCGEIGGYCLECN